MTTHSSLLRLPLALLSVGLILSMATSPAFAEHVRCGDVITQDTTLDRDLIDCPGDGVVIGASGITLDLAGHTIDGTTAAGSVGADNSAGHDSVTVTGGTIRDFVYAVYYADVQGGTVDRLDMRLRVVIENSSDIRVDRNTAHSIGIRGGERMTVTRNHAGVIAGSITYDLVIDRNVVTGDRFGFGIAADFTPRVVISRNTVAITAQDLSAFGAGITVNNQPGDPAHPDIIDRNEVSGSTTGIRLASVDVVALTRNTVFENTADGILATNSVRVLFDHNRAERNGDDGIDVDGASAIISHNFANFNGDFGIEAVPGVTDGGGNKASANGNPAQCLNVRCK